LRSDIWVSAYLRRCNGQGGHAVLRRRGAAEAGAIVIRVDRLDGSSILYGPAPQTVFDTQALDRRFARMHDSESLPADKAEEKLSREIRFDQDLWIVEVDDRAGRSFLLEDERA
jgi:hypothetical protein